MFVANQIQMNPLPQRGNMFRKKMFREEYVELLSGAALVTGNIF
jgi:hypothetical protein